MTIYQILEDELSKLRTEIERLRAERDRLKSEQIDLRFRISELEFQREAAPAGRGENERAVAECARLNELFALKWDATQSAETEAARARIERLEAALQASESLKRGYLDRIERLEASVEAFFAHRSRVFAAQMNGTINKIPSDAIDKILDAMKAALAGKK